MLGKVYFYPHTSILLTLFRLAVDCSMSCLRFADRFGIGDRWCLPWFRTIRGLLLIELFDPRNGCRRMDAVRTTGIPKSPSIKIFEESIRPLLWGCWWLFRMFRSKVFLCGPSGGSCWTFIGGAWCVGVTGMPSVSLWFWFCGDGKLLLLREASSNRF